MGIVCNNSDRKSSLERQQHYNKQKKTAHGTHRPLKKLINMKRVKSTLSWLLILACSMQILTASTVTNTADQKSKPAQTKQAKAKKTNKSREQTPLFKSLLNHL
jgi:hypothetical protein